MLMTFWYGLFMFLCFDGFDVSFFISFYPVTLAYACYFDAPAGDTCCLFEQLLAVFWDTKWFDYGISFS